MRTRIISPRTPRSCGSRVRAAKPRQSTTSPASGPSPSPSSPKRISAPPRAERSGERAHRVARINMALAGEEQAVAETSGEIGFERGDPRLVRPLMPARAPRRSGRSRRRRAAARRPACRRARPGDARVPPVDRAFAQLDHALRRALALAERREHAARKPRGVAAKFARSLEERHLGAALGEGQRSRQADDAGADDGRAQCLTPPRRRRACRPCRGTPSTSPPCRPSPRPPCAGPG